MKKFRIEFYGSKVYEEYIGVVAAIDILAVDQYVADEIAKKLVDKNTAYYTAHTRVREVE